MAINAAVIAEDSRLESAAQRSGEELAKHRWHWTLDESNPDRISLKQYARDVKRSFAVIHADANGYVALLESTKGDRANAIAPSFNELRERAKVGGEKEAAIDALAKATGKSFTTVRQTKADTVRDVLSTARERVERGANDNMEEAIERAAQDRARTERTLEKERQERAKRHNLRYMEIEGHIAAAMQRLRKALAAAENVDFNDEEIEFITDSLGKLRALLNLIDVRITGETDINWDAELARLGGEL